MCNCWELKNNAIIISLKITQPIIPLVFCPQIGWQFGCFLPAGVKTFFCGVKILTAGKKQPFITLSSNKRSVWYLVIFNKIDASVMGTPRFSASRPKNTTRLRLVVFGPEGKKTRDYHLGVKYIIHKRNPPLLVFVSCVPWWPRGQQTIITISHYMCAGVAS